MKESRASVYSLLTGLAGGAAAWAGVEMILHFSSSFPDLRILTLALGAASGLLLGAVAPTAEGLRQAQPRKVITAIAVGGLFGGIAGALGMAAGQSLLAVLAGNAAVTGAGLAARGAAMARIPGWVITGTAVGAVSGIRSRSLRRIIAGAIGGFFGGLLGGIASEGLTGATSRFYGRGAGMVIWGIAVAFLADRMEARRARGRLTVLAGPLKGRSYPINQKTLSIAGSPRADLTIPGDAKGAAPGEGAQILLKRGTVVLEAGEGTEVKVNGEVSPKTELRYDDVVKVGNLTMIYEAKR